MGTRQRDRTSHAGRSNQLPATGTAKRQRSLRVGGAPGPSAGASSNIPVAVPRGARLHSRTSAPAALASRTASTAPKDIRSAATADDNADVKLREVVTKFAREAVTTGSALSCGTRSSHRRAENSPLQRTFRSLRWVDGLEVVPVGADGLDAVRQLFATSRSTQHCWCTAFCSTSWQFVMGWYGGGNRRRFEAMAASETDPMGVLALDAGEPVGWCACGPRRRYRVGQSGRSSLLAERRRGEDDTVWLIVCLFVRSDRAGQGVVMSLLRGAVDAGGLAGATAVEAWPLTRGARRNGEAHVGREGLFARLGFQRVAQPSPDRVVMRLDLRAD